MTTSDEKDDEAGENANKRTNFLNIPSLQANSLSLFPSPSHSLVVDECYPGALSQQPRTGNGDGF